MTVSELLPIRDVTARCEPLQAQAISPADAEAVARSMKALADPTRLRIISMVAAAGSAEACVCDLQEPLGLAQPTVSHHLKVLVEAGFLSRSKRGTWAYYSIVPGSLDAVTELLGAVRA